MHRDYFGSPSQSNLRAKYDQSVEKMRAPDPAPYKQVDVRSSSTNVSLGPNKNVSSFTPYNQQFLPSEPDARRRQKDADDRANYEYSHPSYTGSFLEKEFGVIGSFIKRPGDIALGSMLAAKSAGISDISWFKIIRAWIWWRLIWPVVVFAVLALVLFAGFLGVIAYQQGSEAVTEPLKKWWSTPSQVPKNWTSLPTAAEANLTRPGDQPVRVVAPTAEVYKQQQQEQGLTPVKPTQNYGTNSVINQPAQAAVAPVAPSQEQQNAIRQKLAEETAIRNDYDRIRLD